MLSAEDNELLTGVLPGTPMGTYLRNYWIPALLSEELRENGGKPLRLRLLGEDLVAFRDPQGTVGIVGEHCAHRGASLYYGRNEEGGLRCVYHGWKYDCSGQCVDTPNEPPFSQFKNHVKIPGYKTCERTGMVWVYMGPDDSPKEPPHVEWTMLPRENSYISKRVEMANWAQVLEGGIDSSHGSFLHGYIDRSKMPKPRQRTSWSSDDKAPRYEVMDTEYGCVAGARRSVVEGKYYWRIYQFLFPFYTMVPPGSDTAISGHAFVPRDNETTVVWSATWHPARPLDKELDLFDGPGNTIGSIHATEYLPPTPEADGAWFIKAQRSNDYLMDYEAQKTVRFSGIPGTPTQDAAMQESMGAIYDRRNENLGSADAAIIHVRRRWLEAARAVAERPNRRDLPGLDVPEKYAVRSLSVMLDRDVSWVETANKLMHAEPGVLFTSA